MKHTPIDEIAKTHARLRATFSSGKTVPLEYRRRQLLQVARMFQENADALMDALYSDLGRVKLEANLAEIAPIVKSALFAADKLQQWAAPEKPAVEEWRSGWQTTVFKSPKGLVVNIRLVLRKCTESS